MEKNGDWKNLFLGGWVGLYDGMKKDALEYREKKVCFNTNKNNIFI